MSSLQTKQTIRRVLAELYPDKFTVEVTHTECERLKAAKVLGRLEALISTKPTVVSIKPKSIEITD